MGAGATGTTGRARSTYSRRTWHSTAATAWATNQCDLSEDYRTTATRAGPSSNTRSRSTVVVREGHLRAGRCGGPRPPRRRARLGAAAKGTTLSDAYDAWTTAELAVGLRGRTAPGGEARPLATVQMGTADQDWFNLAPIDANHLSTRYVKFTRGDGDASHICYAATLSLKVTMPGRHLSKPAFYWDGKGSSPVQLAVNGNLATADLPWDTCSYASQPATSHCRTLPGTRSWTPPTSRLGQALRGRERRRRLLRRPRPGRR